MTARVLKLPGDYETIQDAVLAASGGDSIEIGPGVWRGPMNCSVDLLEKEITLFSDGGSGVTTIDCEHVNSGFVIAGGQGPNCLVRGLTIKNAKDWGLYVANASPQVRECNITGCAMGALFDSSRWVDARECHFDSNDGPGVVVVESYGEIWNSTMRGNGQGGSGSGIELHRSNPSIIASVISGNVSAGSGGGVYADSANPLLRYCVITGNRAAIHGGGVCLTAWGSISLENCTVSRNIAEEGGGIYSSGTTRLDRTIIWGNCASGVGRDIYLDSDVFGLATCVDVDSSGVRGSEHVTWSGQQLHSDPGLCDMRSCSDAPTTGGSYTLSANSPCLVGACAPIGALGSGCTDTPILRSTWGRIRFGFR